MIAEASGIAGNAAAHLSEQDHLRIAARMRVVTDHYLSFLTLAGRGQPVDRSAATWISNAKGGVFIEQSRLRSERRHPKLAPLFQQLDDVNQQLVASAASGQPGSPTATEETRKFQELLKRRAKVEVEIARLRRGLPRYMNPPAFDQLPPTVVLLDFYEYDHRGAVPPGQWSAPSRRLACLVCRRDKTAPVLHVDLGPAAPVAEAVKQWRSAIQRGGGGLERGIRVLAAKEAAPGPPAQQVLRRQIWEPLEPFLKDATTVLISPDGVLAFLPFAALPGTRPGTFLLEERPLAYTPVPHLLRPFRQKMVSGAKAAQGSGPQKAKDAPARPLPSQPAEERTPAPSGSETLLLVGDIAYGAARAGTTRSNFGPLEGTGVEILALRDTFEQCFRQGKVTLLREGEATKAAVRQAAPRHRWLHLATHGFFLPQAGDHLGMGSGLALAGANATRLGTASEGLLTAMEVSGLDLADVDLAVLSACETSLGDVVRGEGVRGLQAAFQVAGVRTVVASLWQVDDAATQALMVEFYRNLWERGLGRMEALRQAQLAMLRGRLHHRPASPASGEGGERPALPLSPYYWAAFVLSGDWR
jgi:CHAT domain-containing protein